MARYILWLCLLVPFTFYGQTFQNITSSIGVNAVNADNLHGAGVSTVDFDLDGDQDLTFCLDGEIKVYQNQNGAAVETDLGFVVDDNAKHPVWVDIDNDGDLDFYFSQMSFPNRLYRNDNGNFTEISEEAGISSFPAPSFGCSWGDYDNDGDLDLYQCNYIYVLEEGEEAENYFNRLYRNNGDGTFEDVTLTAGVGDGISLSFQSLWIDIDNDGYDDLYVINDLEHPNSLYLNNADGTFTNVADETGLAVTEMDAMSITPGDFNNDGLEDIFITNVQIMHCALLINQGDGSFVDMASEAGVTLSMLTWGATALDYDNDKDLDIYVCENNYLVPELPNPLLKNNGNLFFQNIGISTVLFDFFNSYSVAHLDWNADGAMDLAVSNYAPQNASVWLSSGNQNRYVKFGLQGTISNHFGVGTQVGVWTNGTAQWRTLYAGQNYLGQHPYSLHFGLFDAQIVDSAEIHWPSGIIEKYYDLPVNQLHSMVEGNTFSCSINSDSDLVLCEGESIVLSSEGSGTPFWNTEETSTSITIEAPGTYSVSYTNEFGFVSTAEVVVEEAQTPAPTISVQDLVCFEDNSGSISVETDDLVESISWWNETSLFTQVGLSVGEYSFTLLTTEGCSFGYSASVSQPEALSVTITSDDVTCFGGNDGAITTNVTGGTSPYEWSIEGNNWEDLSSGEYFIQLHDSNGCEWSTSVDIPQPDELVAVVESLECTSDSVFIEIDVEGGITPYSFQWSEGGDQEVLAAEIGQYDLIVTDDQGCELNIEELGCAVGIEELEDRLLIYPNPATHWLFVDTHSPPNTIFDTMGRVVGIYHRSPVDVSDLNPGAYFLVSKRGAKAMFLVR